MPTASSKSIPRWESVCKWIECVTPYASVLPPPAGELPRSRLSKADILLMTENGLCRPLADGEAALGSVDLFSVPEPSKVPPRRRRIGHTTSINEALGKESLIGVQMPTRKQQLDQALDGPCCISLDFAAYFDAFEAAPTVQPLWSFSSGGTRMCLTRLPMGQRQSVDVAQLTTEVLIDFAFPPGVSVQTCIDNVRFVGDRSGVLSAALEFVTRANRANIRINDIRQRDDDLVPQLEAIVLDVHTWLGIEYDLSRKCVRVGAKSIDKLAAVAAMLDSSPKALTIASLFGLIMFANSVLRGNVGAHFSSMRFLRDFSTDVQADPTKWKSSLTLPRGVAADLSDWISYLIRNEWRPIADDDDVAMTIMVDASAWGWGAIATCADTGAVQQASGAWSVEERRIFKTDDSVHSEPLGAHKALCRFAKFVSNAPARPRTIRVLSDSTTAVAAINKGYSPSFIVNRVARMIRNDFSFFQIIAQHVAGVDNKADGLSRGSLGVI